MPKPIREVTEEAAAEWAGFIEEMRGRGVNQATALELVLIAFVVRWWTEAWDSWPQPHPSDLEHHPVRLTADQTTLVMKALNTAALAWQTTHPSHAEDGDVEAANALLQVLGHGLDGFT